MRVQAMGDPEGVVAAAAVVVAAVVAAVHCTQTPASLKLEF
jgi:hypothetical protein